jgi:acetyl esterase
LPVHPQSQAFLDQAAGQPPPSELPIADARAMMDAFNALAGEPEAVAAVEDRTIPGPGGPLGLRVYRPSDNEPLPVTVYFHAGGYTMGSLESHDSLCRSLANAAGSAVVSVAYRLAPEHRFPAPVDDALAAVGWIAAHAGEIGADGSRLAVVGDSVGGALATVVSILARDAGAPPIRLQVMVYPDVDWQFASSSWTTMGHDYFVTVEIAEWLRRNYFTNEDEWRDWRASPLRCPDLSGLPPALLICPEYNLARSDMEAYAGRLEDAGVPTTFSLYEGTIMGFWSMAGIIDAGREAIDEAAGALRRAFDG